MDGTPQQQGIQMPIQTTAELFPVWAVGLGETPRARDKKTVQGDPTWTTGLIPRFATKDGQARLEKSASINVVNPAERYELGVVYQAQGWVWVMPYRTDSGRLTYSITVTEMVPASPDAVFS